MSKKNVAIIQAEVAPDLSSALDLTAALAKSAAAAGAELIVFPETWIPGYPAWLDVSRDAALWDHPPVKRVYRRLAENSVVLDGASGKQLQAIARSVGATIVIGISERLEEGAGRGTLYNSLLTLGANGALLNHHRKLVPTYTERMIWGGGDAEGLRAVATPAGRIGGLVCWEHWMPLARHALHQVGEDIHVAVWPTAHATHQLASRHYAFEGRCFVLAAAALMRASSLPSELEIHPHKVQTAEQWVLRGGSAIIGPDGQYICEPLYEKAAIIEAELDFGRIAEENMTLDVAGHYHRPELFEFWVRRNRRRAAGRPPPNESA